MRYGDGNIAEIKTTTLAQKAWLRHLEG